MRHFIGLLFIVLAVTCQNNTLLASNAASVNANANNVAAAVTNANRVTAANTPNSNSNTQNVVKIDNNFMLQLLALKTIAMSMNQNNALQQLIALHALMSSNDQLRTLFGGVDLAATNIGLYYDPSSQNFVFVDLANNAKVDIQTLMSRLQASAAQNASANVAPSGIIGNLPIVGPLLGGLPIVGPLVRSLGN